VAKLVAESKAPNVDIQIFFDFDSAEILPQARPSLDELGKARKRRLIQIYHVDGGRLRP